MYTDQYLTKVSTPLACKQTFAWKEGGKSGCWPVVEGAQKLSTGELLGFDCKGLCLQG